KVPDNIQSIMDDLRSLNINQMTPIEAMQKLYEWHQELKYLFGGDIVGIIKQMPDYLANKIAAGEVGERRASVVKELVENAIDAESTQIIVVVIKAGIQQINVSDNGKGIIAEDLTKEFMAHATSMIYETTD